MRPFSLFARSRAGAILLLLDILALLAIFPTIHLYHVGRPFEFYAAEFAGVIGLTCITLYLFDVYRVDYNFPSFSFPAQGVAAVVMAGLVLAAIIYLLPGQSSGATRATIYWRGVLVVSMGLFAVWVALSRFIASAIFERVSRAQRWLVVGSDEIVSSLVKDFYRIRVGEHLDQLSVEKFGQRLAKPERDQGTAENRIFEPGQCAGVVIASKDDLSPEMINALMQARLSGLKVYDIFDFYETFLLKVPVELLHDQWLVMAQGFSLVHHNIQMKLKLVIDKLLASTLLLLSLPVMLLVAAAVRLDSTGGVIYSQERVGLNGRLFRIFKFRSMFPDAESEGEKWADPDDDRITRVGRLLRPSRLDELPQLWNVLKGDMSFVGPRPERPSFTNRLTRQIPYFNLRVLVKPGITGWAQVQYPYGSNIEDARQKFEYDLYYIKNYSILLDLAILFKTVKVVLFRAGR